MGKVILSLADVLHMSCQAGDLIEADFVYWGSKFEAEGNSSRLEIGRLLCCFDCNRGRGWS
jgi:hypothetical protein